MKKHSHKIIRLFLSAALVLMLSVSLFGVTSYARGSGGSFGGSPAAGYKSGNYSAGGGTGGSTFGGGYSGGSYSGSGGFSNFFFFLPFLGHSGSSGSGNGVSAGSVFPVLLVLIILAVIAAVIYNRKKQGRSTKKTRSRPAHNTHAADGKGSDSAPMQNDDYRELYSKIIFAVDDIREFISPDDLSKRRYIQLLPLLKTYVDMIEDAEAGKKRPKTLEKGKSVQTKEMRAFEARNREAFSQLRDCAECKCLKCVRDCKMEGCSRCEPGYGCRVAGCDNKTAAVYTYEDKSITLTNNDTGLQEIFQVLAVVQDLEYRQLYIILQQGVQKLILYYYPGTSGDRYGKISDADDLNFAVKAFESIHL